MKTLKLFIAISCCMGNSFSQSTIDSLGQMKKMLFIEHCIWLSDNQDTCNDLLFKKARLLKQTNRLDDSYRTLNRMVPNKNNNNELTYEKALNSFLRSDFSNSYNLLSSIPDSLKVNTKHILFLWMLTLSELNKWEECKSYLTNNILLFALTEEEISSLNTHLKLKSPEKAKKLSTFIPGLGQIYTGNWGKGATSLILNSAFIGFSFQQYASGFYITGTFAGLYPLSRFYKGGCSLSYNLAIQYNEAQVWKTKMQYQKIIRKYCQSTP